MNVILLEKVKSLGNLGQQIEVKSGYARNYLIPKGIATMATKANIELFEARRADLEKRAAEVLAAAQARAAELAAVGSVSVAMRASEEGKLFGSVTAHDVADMINAAGVVVERNEVHLPGAVRQTGEYTFTVSLHGDVVEKMTLRVTAE
ncbi:MAG: 50S ribosomal protein L9 [Gammaproteobacteria bacterium]|nr:50S ribosomal protein L9 [Gammaproteobacteria bacterium]